MARKNSADADDGPSRIERVFGQMKQLVKFHTTQPSWEVDPETGETWFAPELEELLVLTMRFALTMRGAPKNCPTRNAASSAASCGWRKTATACAPAASCRPTSTRRR